MGNREIYTQIFERTEKKYLVDKDTFNELVRLCSEKLEHDKYYSSDVLSLYFDTPQSRLIRKSLEKPTYKEKLRIRSYGTADEESPVFLELKKKYKGIVYKRRIETSLKKARDFVLERKVLNENPQIEKELSYFLDYYEGIAPAMLISCRRYSFTGENSLRITYDEDLCYRSHDLTLTKSAEKDKPIFDNDKMGVMEIKVLNSMPLWLCDILCRLKIYPCSFSKYGTGYLNELKNTSQGELSYV